MMIYPPTIIQTPDAIVNILQLTDLHLTYDKNKVVMGRNLYQSFTYCLTQALDEKIRCDLILITGDLVNQIDNKIYDRIFSILKDTNIPFVCIAGNHDVTDEVNEHLPFEQRTLVAYAPDKRLVDQHQIIAQDWQILLINSSSAGKINGKFNEATLQWLDTTLSHFSHPAIIALHHPTVALNSHWIDQHMPQEVELFWHIIEKHPHVKAVFNGHAHQEHYCEKKGVNVYTTPATSYQFKAGSDTFALDRQKPPGYRWIQLAKNAKLDSWIQRLST